MKLPAVLLFTGLVAAQSLSVAPAIGDQSGPLQLIVTYRCPPPRRAAFRQFLIETGARRFENWKQEGLLSDYRILFNWYVDVDSWEAMAVLSFPSYDRVLRWRDIEHANPGGLSRDALEIALPVDSIPSDIISQGASEGTVDHSKSIYFAIPFDNPPAGDFRDYANANLVAKARSLISNGYAWNYYIFQNRYPGGKHWRGLLLVEYKDADGFAHNPSWPASIAREPVISEAIFGR
jgi:hypothetical protein